MRVYKRVAVLLALAFLFMMGMWTIDISVSAIANSGYTTNGWWVRDPVRSYHLGLYLAIASVFVMALLAIEALTTR